MAWLGGSLGDSFNSLKGQITKITKEVLAETESDECDPSQTVDERLKELEAFCESQTLEITALREENVSLLRQFEKEMKNLQEKNTKQVSLQKSVSGDRNFEFTDDQLQHICELENKLIEIQEEKDNLQKSLEELDQEHQTEMMEVIKVKDRLKLENEGLNKEYQQVIIELKKSNESLQESQNTAENMIDICLQDNELSMLKNEIHGLQVQINQYEKEKQESCQAIKNEIKEHEKLKSKLEKLVSEITILSEEKTKMDLENKRLRGENEQLTLDVRKKEDDLERLQAKNEEETSIVDISAALSDVHKQLKDLLTFRGCTVVSDEVTKENILQFIDTMDQAWDMQLNSLHGEVSKHEQTLKQLKDDNEQLLANSQNWFSLEHSLNQEIQSLQNECSQLKTQLEGRVAQSQTDDLKRKSQEIAKLNEVVSTRDSEIRDVMQAKASLEKELAIFKSLSEKTDQELAALAREMEQLTRDVALWKDTVEKKEEEFAALVGAKQELETENARAQLQIAELKKSEDEMKEQLKETLEANKALSSNIQETSLKADQAGSVQKELEMELVRRSQTEKMINELTGRKTSLENQVENLKAQVIVNETKMSELASKNGALQDKLDVVVKENVRLRELESELEKWRDASVELEVQRQEMASRKEQLENEVEKLRHDVACWAAREAEFAGVVQDNVNMKEACNRLLYDLEGANQLKQQFEVECMNMRTQLDQLAGQSAVLKEEEKSSLQAPLDPVEGQSQDRTVTTHALQHRRTRSAVEVEENDSKHEVEALRAALVQEQNKYRHMHKEHVEVKEQAAGLQRELDRLRLHLVEVEDHYTQEAVENEKTISELRAALSNAEDQLKNSSTVHKSANVLAHQHVESLQSQIKLMTLQRNDLQAKLSASEDEIYKQSASLTSLQIVLEQFQQDKEREIQTVVTKYDYQMQLSHRRFKELENEIEGMKKQLSEAKNGLNAASRLGEQLEIKSRRVSQVEENMLLMQRSLQEAEEKVAKATESNVGKIDKSLVKNLVVGYVTAPQDRRSQVLRILSSVLDLTEEERARLGVDGGGHSGWLSGLLHPRAGPADPTQQSLSEAFIKFLESESRPQPKMKLLPEQPRPQPGVRSSPASKSPFLLPELELPTFSPQPNAAGTSSSSILKDVLKDS